MGYPDWKYRTVPAPSDAELSARWRRDGFLHTLDLDGMHAEWTPGPRGLPAPVFLLVTEVDDRGRIRWRRHASENSVACKRCATQEAIALHLRHVIEEDIRKEAEERVRREPAPSRSSSPPSDVVERARRYLERMDPSLAGSFGRNAMFHACQVLMRGFALTVEQALPLALEYDARSAPAWGPRAVREKLREAFRKGRMKMRSLVDKPLARR